MNAIASYWLVGRNRAPEYFALLERLFPDAVRAFAIDAHARRETDFFLKFYEVIFPDDDDFVGKLDARGNVKI